MIVKYKCDNCGAEMLEQDLRYIVKLEVYAAPNKIEITEDDLARRDLRRELQDLCEQLRHADPQKVTEEVYAAFFLDLCKQCRDRFVQRIKMREFI